MSEDLNDHDSHVIGALIEARDALRAEVKRATDLYGEVLSCNQECIEENKNLRAKLDAAEMACARIRAIAADLRIEWQDQPSYSAVAIQLDTALSDAGRGYVPKAAVDDAREGMVPAEDVRPLVKALEHDVPTDCFSTGPLTGGPEDRMCVACEALRILRAKHPDHFTI